MLQLCRTAQIMQDVKNPNSPHLATITSMKSGSPTPFCNATVDFIYTELTQVHTWDTLLFPPPPASISRTMDRPFRIDHTGCSQFQPKPIAPPALSQPDLLATQHPAQPYRPYKAITATFRFDSYRSYAESGPVCWDGREYKCIHL
jgi:hypothetical protein